MEIEVNEYVRTKNGKIIRFKKFGTYKTHTRKINGKYERGTFENKCIISKGCHYKYDNIVKHSKNIIDLIEVGDIVNGERILDITGDYIHTNEQDHNKFYWSKDIKTILTHEQFKKNAYRLEEK